MRLGDFFTACSENPEYVLFYFAIIPFAALLGNVMGKNEGHLSPWNYYYSALIYLVAIPGIFSIILNLYHILFDKQSLYDTNVLLQILPILSMALTFFLIKRNVNFSQIPGFGRLPTFLSTVASVMLLLFVIHKMHLFVFSYVPFIWIIVLLVVLFVIIRFGTKRVFQ